MANPHAGEVALTIGGKERVLKLTLGALAELEAGIGADGGLLDMVSRFESGVYSARDVLALIIAGLKGGGWRDVTADDLLEADIAGGPIAAARAAALLLVRAFGPAT
jgi:Phage tail tube protein, GTA-gp10